MNLFYLKHYFYNVLSQCSSKAYLHIWSISVKLLESGGILSLL